MKQLNQAAGVHTPMSVQAGMLFSWHAIAKLFNALPWGMCECKTTDDAKGYVKALVILTLVFLLAAIEEGGVL